MKPISFFFVMQLILICVFNLFLAHKAEAEGRSYLEILGVRKGHVHTITQESSTWEVGASVSWRNETFDPNGKLSEYKDCHYKVGGQGCKEIRRTVYMDGTETNQRKSISYNPDGSVSSWSVGTLDHSGRGIESAEYSADGSVKSKTKNAYVYDKEGRVVEGVGYDEDGSIRSKFVTIYDKKNNKKVVTSYNPDGSIEGRMEYVYDEKNTRRKSFSYNADGILDEKRVFIYDESGLQREEVVYRGDGLLDFKMNFSYKFDNMGNCTKLTISRTYYDKSGGASSGKSSVFTKTITYYEEGHEP